MGWDFLSLPGILIVPFCGRTKEMKSTFGDCDILGGGMGKWFLVSHSPIKTVQICSSFVVPAQKVDSGTLNTATKQTRLTKKSPTPR